MKKLLLLSLFSMVAAASQAASAPVVGLMEQLPVMNKADHVVARPIYIFTNEKLDAPTEFSGLSVGEGKLGVHCCYLVKDLAPLELKRVVAKFDARSESGVHIKSVKGLRYIYAAELVGKQRWTAPMVQVMASLSADGDGSPQSMPVIAASFGKAASLPLEFKVDGKTVKLKTSERTTEVFVVKYAFSVDGKSTAFSEDEFPYD